MADKFLILMSYIALLVFEVKQVGAGEIQFFGLKTFLERMEEKNCCVMKKNLTS